jgi:hypothetical protein
MRRTKLVLAAAAVMLAMLVAFAAPAMANNHNNNWNNWNNNWNWNNGFNHPFFNNGFNDNGVFQSSEQNVESGDSSQTFNVTGGGDNSNACQGIQGISNTGNAVNNTSVLQDNPFNNGFNNGFFNSGFTTGEVGVFDSGNFEISPSSTTTCSQQVNQAASASG